MKVKVNGNSGNVVDIDILQDIQSLKYVSHVRGADFNNPDSHFSDYDILRNAGYRLAFGDTTKGDYIPWQVTQKTASGTEYHNDNIAVKGLTLSNVKVWDDSFNLSDHALCTATLRFKHE